MSTYHLRHYFLSSEDAAAAYIAIWHVHIGSLAALEIATEGFFRVAENPLEVVALIRFADGMDPEQTIRAYMKSPGFLKDMLGFDMAQIERVEIQTLLPGVGSPLD
jgi:hypothetical protein